MSQHHKHHDDHKSGGKKPELRESELNHNKNVEGSQDARRHAGNIAEHGDDSHRHHEKKK